MTVALALLSLVLQEKTPAQKEGFAGSWMTNFGPLELGAKGKALSGTYGWGKDGKVEGKLSGDKLELEWSNPNGRGEGWFEMWKDGLTFIGQSTMGQGQKEFWGGYRIERKRAEPRPGEVSDGQTELHLNYHLRVPFDYDPSKRYTALALFHGSNSNSREYVEGFPHNWPVQAERYILVGLDGESLSPSSHDGLRNYNSSYVNFSGDKVGEPWRYMQTPALVAGALKEIQGELPIERWFVGGHSQGAFLTYAVAMFYPELVRGAFPVAGGLLVQCVPEEFTDDKVREAQRRIPFAIVHGEKDQSVEFSMSTSSRDSFEDGGFPMLHLFSDPKLGHPWAYLPVDDALDWMEELTNPDPGALVASARKCVEEQRWRDATAVLGRVRELDPARARSAEVEAIYAAIDAAAEPELTRLSKALAAPKDDSWVDDFWEFRSKFALAPSAGKVMESYAKLRAKHEKPAANFFWKARSEEDPKKKRELSREIVTRYYASSFYRIAKRWAE
jgi:predicted esterase